MAKVKNMDSYRRGLIAHRDGLDTMSGYRMLTSWKNIWNVTLRSEAIEGYDQKPLEAAITKPANLKNYKSSRSWKMVEAVVKVLVAGIRDVVLETIFVYCLNPEDLEALS
ncbi:hypothetical protein Tco_1357045 [Tanacetum coccineum]